MSKVLVIDDDEMILKAIAACLTGTGLTILTTTDGPQGVEMYDSEKPDVVILDLVLPSSDGLDILKQLLANDPDAKIIICSGYGSQEAIDVAMGYGAFAFLNKPFDMESVVQLTISALHAKNGSVVKKA